MLFIHTGPFLEKRLELKSLWLFFWRESSCLSVCVCVWDSERGSGGCQDCSLLELFYFTLFSLFRVRCFIYFFCLLTQSNLILHNALVCIEKCVKDLCRTVKRSMQKCKLWLGFQPGVVSVTVVSVTVGLCGNMPAVTVSLETPHFPVCVQTACEGN